MDFRHLTEFFEGTIFADDYRTNLDVASDRIAALEACVSANLQVNGRPGLLLAQAVYSSICGNFASAGGYLTQLFEIAQSTNDSSLHARCCAYEVYIRCTINVPPFLRFRVDSNTGSGDVRGIGLSALRNRFLRKRTERGIQEPSLLDVFERNILRTCTNFLNDLWLEAFPENPRYFKDHSVVLFQEEKSYGDIVKHLQRGTDFPAITSYLNKLTLQYRLAGNASNARSSLLTEYEDAIERGDLGSAANCHLQLGDAILSPPFTSPFALNLVSVVSSVGWHNDMWDKKEQEFLLQQDVEAMQCYQQAYFFFEASGSRRGMAAIRLRYACLDLAEAIMESTAQKDAQKENDLVQSAYNHLIAAKEMFQGDTTNSLIVNGHLAVCYIMRKDFSTALKVCFDTGDVGKRSGNTCASEFVGILHLRLARRLALDEARVKHAIMLCACATVCFRGLSDPYLELHAVAASIELHQQRGDIPVAAKHVEKGRKLLEPVVTYFDNLQAQVGSLRSSHEHQEQTWLDHDLGTLHRRRTKCIADFDQLASAVNRSKQSTSSSSLNYSSQPLGTSPMMAMLQSVQSIGLDPSMMGMLRSLITGATSIDDLRQRYEDAIKRRRDELVIKADIDAAEKHLTDFLKELEKSSIFSEELETMKTVALQYLGDFDGARSAITRVLPTSFGGTRVALPELEGANEQLRDKTATYERHKFFKAVSLCFAAKDWERGMIGIQDVLQRDPTSLDDMKSSDDPHRWYNMVWIACILEQNGDIGQAFKWYLNAFHVVEAHRQQLADIKDRRDILSYIHSGEIFLGMARIAFQFSQPPDGRHGPSQQWSLTSAEWKDQGLRFLELGRSRTLLDLLIVQKLAPKDLEDWSEYSYQLRFKEAQSSTKNTTETKPQNCADNEPESREEYLRRVHEEFLTDLKSPSLSKLLPEPAAIRESNEKLYKCISETAIVLHISSGRQGMMILCITSQGIIHIHIADVTDLELERHIFRFAKLFRELVRLEPSSLPAIATCDRHLQAISGQIIEPVAQYIKPKQHVIFVPSPSLNKIPLCALFYDKKPLFLSKDVSQVPSLSVLQYLVDKEQHANKKVSIIYKNPDPGTTHDEPLNLSTAAAINIARSFHAEPQAATGTLTQDKFVEMYEQSDVLLIATHGTQSTKSAWESHLSILQPPFFFRVLDLARLHSNASLVIFEACVSGLGEESIGNDLLGFSHAVLASGAAAFLGGLWKVSDEASALLMLFFFEEFKASKGSESLARCWRNAQIRLYELDVAGAVAIIEGMKKGCTKAYKAGLIDRDLATQLLKTLSFTIMDLHRDGVNFRHPFYWAPFLLMGYAERMDI